MRLEGCAALRRSTLRTAYSRAASQWLRHDGSSNALLPSKALLSSQRVLPSSDCSWRQYSSTSLAYPERIAVLGGGIAGLSSAYFISKEFPKSKITVFEAGKETGGWIRSKRVEVPGGDILFELGPRTLRNATPTAALIQELGLVDDITYTKRTDPGAKNRFIYYPDQLNRLPSEPPSIPELFELWRTGILAGALNVIKEPFIPKRAHNMSDETVGSFLSRRVDKRVANNIISAVFHGIYAGDIWQLSAKRLLGLAWQLEERYGSALGGFFRMQSEDPRPQQVSLVHPYDVELAKAMNEDIYVNLDFAEQLQDTSMFSFKNGLQHLVRALEDALEKKENVTIKTESPIQSFKPVEQGQGVEIISGASPDNESQNFDLAISTLRNPTLTPYVTVMTVNLFFPSSTLLPVEGFGYLIPQSIPFDQNPERALGVIFDSSAVRGQDNLSEPGTKITVMLGGHWWDSWSSYPTEEEGLEMARSVIKRHLGITDEPLVHHVNLAQDCIPQYTIGYEERLRDFAHGISDEFKGRLRVVGSQFNGVGVNDCIGAAWILARGLRGEGWKRTGTCGLERVDDDRPWVVASASEVAYTRRYGGTAGKEDSA